MHLRVVVFGMLTVAIAAHSVEAQVATVAEDMGDPFAVTGRPHDNLKQLTRHYNTGSWSELQTFAIEIINAARAAATDQTVKDALDVKKNHVAVGWIGSDAFGKTLMMRAVVHDPSPELFAVDLPGVRHSPQEGMLIELFLARTSNARSTSVYASTPEKDPALDVLPAFIQAIAGPLFQTFATISPVRSVRQLETQPITLIATVKRVGLPFRRASVTLRAVARDPWFDTASFKEAVGGLTLKLRFEEVSSSSCARGLAEKLRESLASPPPNFAADCTATPPSFAKCKQEFDAVIEPLYRTAVSNCPTGPSLAGDLTAMKLVDQRFRELVNASITNTAELDLSFRNRPPTHIAFGAGTAVMFKPHLSKPRVKLDDAGTLVADPLNRVMTMAFVNWSPRGYDAESTRVSKAERTRLFFGAALTPDFGTVIGANVLIARGIGITVGVAMLFGKGATKEEIGAPPANSQDAYRLTVSSALFTGISYNYK